MVNTNGSQLQIAEQDSCTERVKALQGAQGTKGHIFLTKLPKEDSGPSYHTSTWSNTNGSQLQIADQDSCTERVEALQGAQGTKGHIFLAKLPKGDSGPSYRTSTWSIPDGSQLQIADQDSCTERVEALQGARAQKGTFFSLSYQREILGHCTALPHGQSLIVANYR